MLMFQELIKLLDQGFLLLKLERNRMAFYEEEEIEAIRCSKEMIENGALIRTKVHVRLMTKYCYTCKKIESFVHETAKKNYFFLALCR